MKKAKQLIDNGHKHRMTIRGTVDFKQKVRQAVNLTKTAGCHSFLTTYIRKIQEIDGLTQLRQTEATMWANKYAVKNPVDAASLLIQKANQMKEYLEQKLYYGGDAENRSDQKRIEFLETLKNKTTDKQTIKECEKLLEMWKDNLVY